MVAGTFYARHLPHYHPPAATFFITFRLKGSLPAHAVARLAEERDGLISWLAELRDDARRQIECRGVKAEFSERFEEILDEGCYGPDWLKRNKIAEMVSGAIKYRDGRDYELLSFCIMPNHVHMLIDIQSTDSQMEKRKPLSRILQSLKRYTAREANKSLNRRGAFWQDESYDHVIRDHQELERLLWYILWNPVKAGLVDSWEDWPWTYCKPGLLGLPM